jgi:hypothetical protein
MDNYRNYLEYYLNSADDCNFFSASANAVKIDGVKYQALDMLLQDYPESKRIQHENLNTEKRYVKIEEIDRLFSKMLSELYEYSQQLKNNIDSVSEWIEEKITELKILTENILNSYPFLKNFLLMTQIVLDRNNITPNNPEYFRHISFCLLQSIYFMIRELQKAQKRK